MRWQVLATVVLAVAGAVPARAQVGPYRRFTEYPMDTNRNDRIVYVPLGWAFSGARPAQQSHDVSAAVWFETPVGSRDRKPDRVHDKNEYRLEALEGYRDGDRPMLRVVISRSPAPAAGTDLPELRVVEPGTMITARAEPESVDRAAGGVRFTFLVPATGLVSDPQSAFTPGAPVRRYEIHLNPAREVRLPDSFVRKPTFSGADREARWAPQSTPRAVRDKVAGYRSERRFAEPGTARRER